MKQKVAYAVWGSVAIIGVALAILMETGKDAFAVAAAVAVIGGLAQFFRDQTQNAFAMGATSHMAEVAFDKHVEFCEEYFKAMLSVLADMSASGPHKSAAMSGAKLAEIRRRWAIWISPELDALLARYDFAIFNVGADANLLVEAPNDPDSQETRDRMYRNFSEVLGLGVWKGGALDPDKSANQAIAYIRKAIGNDALTHLRERLLTNALDSLQARPASSKHPKK
jgi:hypothetical protein